MMRFGSLLKNKTIRNGGLFSIFSFFGKGVAFLIVLMLAGFLDPSDYGKLSLFNTIISLFTFMMAFSTTGYVSVSFFNSSKEDFSKDLSIILVWGLCSVALISTVIIVCKIIGVSFPVEYKYVWFGLLIAFFVFIFNLHQDVLRVQEKIVNYGIFNCSNALLNLFACYILFDIFNFGWTGRVYSYLTCAALYAVISLFLFAKEGLLCFRFEKQRMLTIFLWGIPLIPHSISSWLRIGADQNIINSYYGTYEVGMFGFALNLMSIIVTIGIAFNSSNSVSIYQILSSDESNKKAHLRHQTKMLFLVYLLMAVLVVILATVVVRLWYTKYTDSLNYFYVLSIMGFLQCIYFLFCNYLFYYSKTKELMYITFGSSVLHFALSLLFTKYSLFYTCIIYVVVQIIIVTCVYIKSMSVLKKNIG